MTNSLSEVLLYGQHLLDLSWISNMKFHECKHIVISPHCLPTAVRVNGAQKFVFQRQLQI